VKSTNSDTVGSGSSSSMSIGGYGAALPPSVVGVALGRMDCCCYVVVGVDVGVWSCASTALLAATKCSMIRCSTAVTAVRDMLGCALLDRSSVGAVHRGGRRLLRLHDAQLNEVKCRVMLECAWDDC
jgi:hypothetical protein